MKRLVTANELAKMLDMKLESVWRYARRGDIPVFRVGRLMRFDPERVLAAVEQKDMGRNENEEE